MMDQDSNTQRGPGLGWAVGWTILIFVVAAAAWGARFYLAARPTDVADAPPIATSPASEPVPPPQLSPIELAAWRQRAWDKIVPRLDEVDRASEAAIAEKLGEVQAFFAERRAGVPHFAQEVLSLSGKWKYVKSKLPSAADDAHLKYLNERFEQYVFPTADLRRVLESSIGGYMSRVDGLEAQLLVDIRADLSDSELAVPGAPQLAPTEAALRAEFTRLINTVATDVARDVDVCVSLTIGSLVGGEVAAVVAVRVAAAVGARLGVSGGLLGAGAASSWGTFGLGLVAAVVVDAAIERIAKAAGYDPVKKVAAHVNTVLDQVQTMLLDGDPAAAAAYGELRTLAVDDPDARVRAECRAAAASIERSGNLGLRRELETLHQSRAAVRREALRRLVYVGET